MYYFNDYSMYQYYHFENAFNIGFCFADVARDSQTNDILLKKLTEYLEYPFNAVRGGEYKRVKLFGKEYTLGYAEIRVLSDGKVYAAPNMIVSNIIEGSYTPPVEFIKAVENGISPQSSEYKSFIEKYDESHYWGASDDYINSANTVCEIIACGDNERLKDFLLGNDQDSFVTKNGSLINEAIIAGQTDIAKYLIECDQKINRFDGIELLTAIDHDMDEIVEALLQRNIYIKLDLARNNPLFFAIAKNKNRIAQRLYVERNDLVLTYDTEHIKNCNILQWTKMFGNDSFASFLRNRI